MEHRLFKRLGLAVSAAALITSLGASVAMAGEITGNGKPLWTSTTTIVDGCGPGCDLVFHTLHGKSNAPSRARKTTSSWISTGSR